MGDEGRVAADVGAPGVLADGAVGVLELLARAVGVLGVVDRERVLLLGVTEAETEPGDDGDELWDAGETGPARPITDDSLVNAKHSLTEAVDEISSGERMLTQPSGMRPGGLG